MPSAFQSFLAGAIPGVDVQDIQSLWVFLASLKGGGGGIDIALLAKQCSPGANVNAVFARVMLVRAMAEEGRLDQWREGDSFEDKVFAVASEVPITPQETGLVFDAEAFIRLLR